MHRPITEKQLARVCAAVFFASLVPLILIALYNYPADDDFGFTLPAATAWVNTHSLTAVLAAIVQKTVETYQTWQGNFVSTFLFAVNPLIFNIRLYFISNWLVLALLCLSVGYLLKSVLLHYLHASHAAFWIIYPSVMVLMLQFMPSIGDSVYWHNGGQYTVAACQYMLALGLLVHCDGAQSLRRNLLRATLLALSGLMLGGSFYGPALGAFVGLAWIAVAAFAVKDHRRWYALTAFLCFCATFAISVTAPGVPLRQERTGEATG
ncbi:MAG TPA: hypothetical protein PLR69_12890, partial [Candidatus Limiplasma sp.]|nr:hypothetical protein [Candidatus Limiplasma sp.]